MIRKPVGITTNAVRKLLTLEETVKRLDDSYYDPTQVTHYEYYAER